METLTRDEYFPNGDSVVSVLPRSPAKPISRSMFTSSTNW